MTFQNDPNINRPRVGDTRGSRSWLLPIGLAALAVILGIFFLMPSDRSTTATNNSPATTTRTAPAPTPSPATPTPSTPRPATGG